VLNEKRNEYFKKQYKERQKFVDQAKIEHDKAQQFIANILAKNDKEIKNFLKDRNMGAPLQTQSRTIVLMDATGSMSHLLHQCKLTVATMFERAAKVLLDNKLNPMCFEMQFAVYRNYNSRQEQILEYSTWESKPERLRSFMQAISSAGGWGNEAVEIGFWHANQEATICPISQVILIGDAPANTQAEVASKRSSLGETYWKQTKFSSPTYWETELTKCTVPVHAFYVDNNAKENFKLIATRTKGRCESLNVNSPSGAELLTHLVTEEILRDVGGGDNGIKLVEEYRKRYK